MIPLRRLIPDPVRRAGAFRTNPRWAGRFLVLAALYVVLGLAGSAARIGITGEYLPPSAAPEARAAAGAMLSGQAGIRSLFLPVRLFLGWSLFALALYYTCRVWRSGEGFRFVHILAAEVYAEGALFLGSAAALVPALLSGDPAVPWIPLGLDAAFPADDFTARYVLNAINVFSAAYVAVLTAMVSVMLRIPPVKAFISVLLVWAAALSANAGIIHALRTEFRFGL